MKNFRNSDDDNERKKSNPAFNNLSIPQNQNGTNGSTQKNSYNNNVPIKNDYSPSDAIHNTSGNNDKSHAKNKPLQDYQKYKSDDNVGKDHNHSNNSLKKDSNTKNISSLNGNNLTSLNNASKSEKSSNAQIPIHNSNKNDSDFIIKTKTSNSACTATKAAKTAVSVSKAASNPASAAIEIIRKSKDILEKKKETAATSHPILIILIACIILIIAIISIFITCLTPQSVVSVFTQTFETRNEHISDTVDKQDTKWSDKIKSFFSGETKIGFHVNEGTEEVLTYDFNYEYDKILLNNKTLIDSALKKAYNLAVTEAKNYCNSQGYSWEKSKGTLIETESNNSTQLFSNINYGDFITVVNMAYIFNSNHSDNDDIIFGTDLSDFDSDAFQDFILDTNNLKYYYDIYYGDEKTDTSPIDGKADSEIILTAEAEAQYNERMQAYNNAIAAGDTSIQQPTRAEFVKCDKFVTISIRSFSISSLYQMIGVNPSEKCINELTYEYLRLEQLDQLKAIAVNSYDAMGFQYLTPYEHNLNPATVVSTTDISNLIDSDSTKTIWNILKAAGFSDAGAAGTMGNIQAESGFRTTALSQDGNGSYGICQWTSGRRTALESYCSTNNLDITSIAAQGLFLVNYDFPMQCQGYSEKIKTATDPIEAADYFCIKFERPQNYKNEAEFNAKVAASSPNSFIRRLSWSRFGYSMFLDLYALDLGNRQSYAQTFYDMYSEN